MLPDPPVLAKRLLGADLPGRYEHVLGVARRSAELVDALDLQGEMLVSAAWLHDIGYAPEAVKTGFHPLDGAMLLSALGYGQHMVSLVAFHSGARIEAELRGLLDVLLTGFGEPDANQLELLTYCDMTTGPNGESVTIDRRIEDIRERYGPDHIVFEAIKRAEPGLRSSVTAVEKRLALAQSQ